MDLGGRPPPVGKLPPLRPEVVKSFDVSGPWSSLSAPATPTGGTTAPGPWKRTTRRSPLRRSSQKPQESSA